MEASKIGTHEGTGAGRPDAAPGSVRAIDDRLVIEEMVIEDERAARVVRERANNGVEPIATVRDAIEIGARVLEREGTAAEVDYVQREFERTAVEVRDQFTSQAKGLTETVQEQLEKVFADEGGVMSKTLDSHAEELTEQLTRHFGEGSSEAVQHQVKEIVETTMRESRESLVRHLSSDEGSNPLADFKTGVNQTVVEAVRVLKEEEKTTREKLDALQVEMTRLTEQTDAKRQLAEAEEVGTRKGRSFEDSVAAALERIADGRGDSATKVGDDPGRGGTKKGDVVVEIDAANGPTTARVVFEVKDSQLSKKKAWDELNGAMEEREAEFGVLVVGGEEKIPSGREQLHEYEGNKLIVAVDPESPDELGLDLAYRYARCRLLVAREAELTTDAPAVRDAAAEALSALKQAQSIKLALSKADKGVSAAREGLEEMAAELKLRLERIESLVGEAD
jgi:hypothetical protein